MLSSHQWFPEVYWAQVRYFLKNFLLIPINFFFFQSTLFLGLLSPGLSVSFVQSFDRGRSKSRYLFIKSAYDFALVRTPSICLPAHRCPCPANSPTICNLLDLKKDHPRQLPTLKWRLLISSSKSLDEEQSLLLALTPQWSQLPNSYFPISIPGS